MKKEKPMSKAVQQVTKRHIEGHGYQCLINGDTMAIIIPFTQWCSLTGKRINGHQVERVISLKDAYIKMGLGY